MRWTRRSFAAFLAASALPIRARGQDGLSPDEEHLPGTYDPWSRMRAPVTINGQGPFPFTLDTGSDRSVVARSLADRLALPAGPNIRLHSASNVIIVPSARLAQVGVGSRSLKDVIAPVLDEAAMGALGLVGLDVLAGQKAVLDFRQARLTVGPSKALDDGPGDVVVRAKSRYGQLLLVDCAAGGVDLFVVLDTGGAMSVGNTVLKRTLQRRASVLPPTTASLTDVTGLTVQVDQMRLPPVRLGGVMVRNMPIAYADLRVFRRLGLEDRPAMLLGMDILRAFDKVAMDFKARKVSFLLPRKA